MVDVGTDAAAALSSSHRCQPQHGVTCALPGEAQISRLFEMTGDLLAAISLDGRFTLLNPAWEQLLGWSIEELKAHPMQELVHPDDLEQTLALTLAGHHRAGAVRELHQPLPPPRRVLALAFVERALRRRGLVRGREGRDRPHVAGAPGAARPADEAAQPPAL